MQPSTSKNYPDYMNNLINDYDIPKSTKHQPQSYVNISKLNDNDKSGKSDYKLSK